VRTKYTARELKKLKPGEYAVIDRGRFEVFCETNGGNLQKLRVASKMKKEDLAEIVERVQSILFVTDDTTVDTEGASAGADAVDLIYDVLREHNMLPIDTNIEGPANAEDSEPE
jgi:hypothetical protein